MESENLSPLQRRTRSFQYAIEGCWYVVHTQPNAKIHAVITIIVIVLGIWLGLAVRDWAVLVLTIVIVWMAEFANTSLEALVDLYSPDTNPKAKVAKDVAAGAVLVGAIGAIVVGLFIIGPPLFDRIF